MNKDMVFICASASLNVGKVTIVKYAGKVIEPMLIYGSSLTDNCRGILVPYGSDVTFNADERLNYYFLPYAGNDSNYSTIMVVPAKASVTFKAVRDLYIKDVRADGQSDAPT